MSKILDIIKASCLSYVYQMSKMSKSQARGVENAESVENGLKSVENVENFSVPIQKSPSHERGEGLGFSDPPITPLKRYLYIYLNNTCALSSKWSLPCLTAATS